MTTMEHEELMNEKIKADVETEAYCRDCGTKLPWYLMFYCERHLTTDEEMMKE